jgi:transcriptional regulator with XRE-family HTH domain
MRRGRTETTPRVFGKLFELSSRRLGWTLETLAEKAGVELSELVSIETDRRFVPQPNTVAALARTLGYPAERLMEVSGISQGRSEPMNEATLRFAARCEPASELTNDERESYDDFAKALVVP